MFFFFAYAIWQKILRVQQKVRRKVISIVTSGVFSMTSINLSLQYLPIPYTLYEFNNATLSVYSVYQKLKNADTDTPVRTIVASRQLNTQRRQSTQSIRRPNLLL